MVSWNTIYILPGPCPLHRNIFRIQKYLLNNFPLQKVYNLLISNHLKHSDLKKNMYSKKASYVQFSIQFMHLTKCLKHNHAGLSQHYQKGTNKRSVMTSFLYDDMYIPYNNKKNLSSFSQFVKDTKSFRHIM